MKPDENLISFSHSVRVLFITCAGCDTKNAEDIFNIFFSKLDIVNSKEEAIEHFNNNKYDLIIAGLKLPEVSDGLEMLEYMRDISKSLTILTIAPALTQAEFTKLIELSIDGFIIKPIEITQFSEVIHKTIQKLKDKEDLYHYKIDLENKVQEQLQSLREKDKILTQQSKMASMGEMIDAIAHQWKQPLSNIKLQIEMIKYDFEDNNVDKNYIDELYTNVSNQIQHMNSTLHEFRTFFRPSKETSTFSLKSTIEKTLLLMKDELIKNTIQTTIQTEDDLYINGIQNELIHVIINLINNSKDAFIINEIKKREIIFKIKKEENYAVTEFIDTAGGIPLNIIDNIFTANVTSKENNGGTGIGLYMTQQILEKHSAIIEVENYQNGAKFTLKFNLI